MKPNIFKYATSELSQDAFFCWLLEWSSKEYNGEELNKISLKFINYICKNTNIDRINSIESIEIRKQEKNIDFYVIINNRLIILFEDKTKTKLRGDQLKRYKEYIENKYKNYEKSFVYIKSDIIFSNETKEVEKENYLIIDLYKLIEILDDVNLHVIYNDYIDYLHDKRNNYLSYKTNAFHEWSEKNWLGFIHELNYKLENSEFGKHYKGNDTWWLVLSSREEEDHELTLEINDKECMLKTKFNKNDKHILIFKEKLIEQLEEYLADYKVSNSASTGGKSMTVAYIKDYMVLENSIINFDKTLDKIKDIIDRFNKYYDNLW